jgi:hypothetical protein
MSPTTAIVEPLQDCKISFARSDVIVCMVPSLTVEKTDNVITIQKKASCKNNKILSGFRGFICNVKKEYYYHESINNKDYRIFAY